MLRPLEGEGEAQRSLGAGLTSGKAQRSLGVGVIFTRPIERPPGFV